MPLKYHILISGYDKLRVCSTHVMFDLIKMNCGAIGLLVRFIWVSVNAAIRTLMHTKQAGREPETKKNGSRSASKQTLVWFKWNVNVTQTKYF